MSALFDPGREGFLDGTIDWNTATIKVSPVRGYTFNAAHRFVSEVVATGTLHGGAAVTLTSPTATNGVADAADITFTALTATAAAPCSLLVYQASAAAGGADLANTAQRVIAWIDTGTNIPFTPNGGDVAIAWDNTANRIFRL
jgi:hypothetical protein